MDEKKQLRDLTRRERALGDHKESWLHIASCAEMKSAAVIASYLSYGDEPRTDDLNEALLRAGKTLVLPRTKADKDLEWISWSGDRTQLRKIGKIYEPMGEPITDPASIDVVIIPSLRIDRTGSRLGQGGGSYDRALAKLNAWKIGLVRAGELMHEPLPIEIHDQRVDAAATPNIITRFTR